LRLQAAISSTNEYCQSWLVDVVANGANLDYYYDDDVDHGDDGNYGEDMMKL